MWLSRVINFLTRAQELSKLIMALEKNTEAIRAINRSNIALITKNNALEKELANMKKFFDSKNIAYKREKRKSISIGDLYAQSSQA